MSALTETLSAHRMIRHPHKHQTVWVAWVKCRCGWEAERVPRHPLHWEEPDLIEALRVDHEVHVAAVIAETHAIVELPKQVDGWWPGGNSEIHIDGSDVVQVSFGRSIYRSTRMTRTLAAGLLAAANAIEVRRDRA